MLKYWRFIGFAFLFAIGFLITITTGNSKADNTAVVNIINNAHTYGCEQIRNCFDPYNAQVNMGEIVLWFNHDATFHTVTSGNRDSGPDGTFDDTIQAEGTFSFKFDKPGSYNYFCKIHPWMTGLVTVAGASSQPTQLVIAPPPNGTSILISSGSSSSACAQTNSCFTPNKFSANSGDMVTWYNQDTVVHTVASGDPHSGPDHKFVSQLIAPGKTFSLKTANAGVYDYYCQVHPWMTGELIVNEIANNQPVLETSQHTTIPSWVRHVFTWWEQGQVTDDQLLSAIKFLVQSGIMSLK